VSARQSACVDGGGLGSGNATDETQAGGASLLVAPSLVSDDASSPPHPAPDATAAATTIETIARMRGSVVHPCARACAWALFTARPVGDARSISVRRASHIAVVVAAAAVVMVVVGCSFPVDDYRVVVTGDDGGGDAANDVEDAKAEGDVVASDGGVETGCPLAMCFGACVDLDNDSKHCGSCDHSCPSGQCKKGKCR
jgi:hypothetical protein